MGQPLGQSHLIFFFLYLTAVTVFSVLLVCQSGSTFTFALPGTCLPNLSMSASKCHLLRKIFFTTHLKREVQNETSSFTTRTQLLFSHYFLSLSNIHYSPKLPCFSIILTINSFYSTLLQWSFYEGFHYDLLSICNSGWWLKHKRSSKIFAKWISKQINMEK